MLYYAELTCNGVRATGTGDYDNVAIEQAMYDSEMLCSANPSDVRVVMWHRYSSGDELSYVTTLAGYYISCGNPNQYCD